MPKTTLVAYFSASGVTKGVAEKLAKEEGADLFEIVPEVPYTPADLNWRDKNSRSSVEMLDLNSRPAFTGHIEHMDQYDYVYLGFPIWWNREPSIVDTFLETYDFTDKTIVPFCTSGGGGIRFIGDRIKALIGPDVTVVNGKRMGGQVMMDELKIWHNGIEHLED
ncbi:MAG: flavodoxin [Atopobiaceae bacterium]|nr:flavodoxin [Atopobiaceae bacterium]